MSTLSTPSARKILHVKNVTDWLTVWLIDCLSVWVSECLSVWLRDCLTYHTQSTADKSSWWCPSGLLILLGSLFRYSTSTWTPWAPNSSCSKQTERGYSLPALMLELPCKHKAIYTEQVKWKSFIVMFNLKHKTALVKNKKNKNLEIC